MEFERVDGMIKAIDTNYSGYLFRSRTEARWAVFFDHLGWEWNYELEGFAQEKTGWYLPDFFFPDVQAFGEVKADILTSVELSKCTELSETFNPNPDKIDFFLMEGIPKNRPYRTLASGLISEPVIFMPKGDKFYPFFASDTFDRNRFYETLLAATEATSARFEFHTVIK